MKEINRLAIVFKERKVSNRTIAEATKSREETVSRWVNNKQQPSVLTLYEIAKYLQIDIRDLFHPTNWDSN